MVGELGQFGHHHRLPLDLALFVYDLLNSELLDRRGLKIYKQMLPNAVSLSRPGNQKL
jgi:hypothetical protein